MGWIHKHDFLYAEKTGKLTEKSGIQFHQPGKVGFPCAHDGHAYVCV